MLQGEASEKGNTAGSLHTLLLYFEIIKTNLLPFYRYASDSVRLKYVAEVT
jgi:hypothetical protein